MSVVACRLAEVYWCVSGLDLLNSLNVISSERQSLVDCICSLQASDGETFHTTQSCGETSYTTQSDGEIFHTTLSGGETFHTTQFGGETFHTTPSRHKA